MGNGFCAVPHSGREGRRGVPFRAPAGVERLGSEVGNIGVACLDLAVLRASRREDVCMLTVEMCEIELQSLWGKEGYALARGEERKDQ